VKLSEEWLQSLMVDQIAGVELVDLEEAGNRAHRIVRLFIDYPGGVTHELCSRVSEAVGAALDEADNAEGPYSLEVSSPGIERVLKKPAHFEAHVGQMVYVKTFAPVGGQKVWQGVLREMRGDSVVVVDGAHEAEIGLGNVAKAHLVFEFK
jgi:ribosome maturation factor RimP